MSCNARQRPRSKVRPSPPLSGPDLGPRKAEFDRPNIDLRRRPIAAVGAEKCHVANPGSRGEIEEVRNLIREQVRSAQSKFDAR